MKCANVNSTVISYQPLIKLKFAEAYNSELDFGHAKVRREKLTRKNKNGQAKNFE